MQKLLVAVGVLAGLAIVGVVVLTMFLGSIVTAGVNRFAPSSIVTATAQAAGDIGKTGGAAAAEGVKKTGDAIRGLFRGDKK